MSAGETVQICRHERTKAQLEASLSITAYEIPVKGEQDDRSLNCIFEYSAVPPYFISYANQGKAVRDGGEQTR